MLRITQRQPVIRPVRQRQPRLGSAPLPDTGSRPGGSPLDPNQPTTQSRRRLLGVAAAIALGLVLCIPQSADLTAGQSRGRDRPKFKSHHAGDIPTKWGLLHSVAVTGSGNYHFVFRDKDEKLRIIRLEGGKLPDQVIEITRKY